MIKYILTTKPFFLEGPCGRVSHAKGFIEGLAKNKQYVTLVSGKGAKDFIVENSYTKIKEFKYGLLLICFYEVFISILKRDKIVIRWRPILPLLFFVYLFFYRNIYFEVNSITGLNSKNFMVRAGVRLSIYLIARFAKIIVVSESSKKQILSLTNPIYPIYVMPNGFNPSAFNNFNPSFKLKSQPNIVYFGKKQSYYDWDGLYRVMRDHPNINLHVFGFNDHVNLKNIFFHGKFDHKLLIEGINEIVNPILILHPDDSEIAKSGSPMKMFEYAYLNIPVIIGDSLYETAKDFNEFIFYRSGDYKSLNATILHVFDNYNVFVESSKTLRERVEINYTWDSIVGRWIEHEIKK
ncbi:hypothetical protein ACT43X_17720 [Acinetobacter baumannii]